MKKTFTVSILLLILLFNYAPLKSLGLCLTTLKPINSNNKVLPQQKANNKLIAGTYFYIIKLVNQSELKKG